MGPPKPARLTFAVCLAIGGCAHVETPPGGPEDTVPPSVVATRPEPEAVVPEYDGPVVFAFDERISERGVEDAVLVSPRTSPVVVGRGRDEIRVSLRRGWEPGQIYHVTLRPGILDLFGNRMSAATTLVFSTGPAIPDTRASGTVEDRLTGRSQADIRVEAIRTTDSLVYAIPSDSAGNFVIDRIPPGEYLFRGYDDVNRSRSLDDYEPRDSVVAAVAAASPVELTLSLLEPDSTPPEARSGAFRQGRIVVEFDDYLDPDQPFDSSRVTIVGPDGVPVPVGRVTIGPDSEIFPSAATADTAARLPARQVYVDPAEAAEIQPETEYTVSLRGIRNVNGLESDVEVTVTSPAAPPVAASLVSRPRFDRYIAPRRAAGADPKTRTFVVDNGRTELIGWLAGG